MNKKIILVTGGSRGLGAKIVEKVANRDNNIVYFTYLNSSQNATKLEFSFENARAVMCDQREEDQVKKCVELIHKEHGKIDILINNACSSFCPVDFLKSDWSSFHEILESNLKGSYLFMRETAEIMKKVGSGKIINILSSYVINMPPERISHYITAKYALLGLSKTAAAELVKHGITVNMISPGLMATDLSSFLPVKYLQVYSSKHPMKRMTTTDDTANVLEFLISENSEFLNGINIPVNGGEAFG